LWVSVSELKEQSSGLLQKHESSLNAAQGDTLEQILTKIIPNHVHRLFVVESETNRPQGVVALSDVLDFICHG